LDPKFGNPELTYIALRDYYRSCLVFATAHSTQLLSVLEEAEKRACAFEDPAERYRAAAALARARFEFDIGAEVYEKWVRDFAHHKSRGLP